MQVERSEDPAKRGYKECSSESCILYLDRVEISVPSAFL